MKFCILLLLFTLTLCQGTETQYSGFINERHLPYLRPYEAKIKYYEGEKGEKVMGDKGKEAEEYKRQETKSNEKQEEDGYRNQELEGYRRQKGDRYRNHEAEEHRRQEGNKKQEGERYINQEREGHRRRDGNEYRNQDVKDYIRQEVDGYRRLYEENLKRQKGEGYLRQKEQGNKEQKDQYEVYYGPNFGGLEGRRFDGYGPGGYKNEGGYERGYKEEPLILGRFGLGFDRRTASSIGLQEPLTLQQLQTVGQGYYGRLIRKGGPIPIEHL